VTETLIFFFLKLTESCINLFLKIKKCGQYYWWHFAVRRFCIIDVLWAKSKEAKMKPRSIDMTSGEEVEAMSASSGTEQV
jgi:hypothetical protein